METTPMEERAALVALLRERPQKLSWSDIAAEVLETGSARAVWDRLVPPTLMDSPEAPGPLEEARRSIRTWTEEQRNTLTTIVDADYPARLRGIYQAPPVLFSRGALRPDDTGVSVVGSRNASARGLKMAAGVAGALVDHGVTVIAGLAAGIDTAAHRAALAAGGRTVAVIGTGINKYYPAANRALHDEIASRGLLISQFWPDAPPQKQNFLMRNATMSGYGVATVVVEAGEHSGTRSQARMAVEHGRPVVLTDSVVEANMWAQELVGKPGVHVADSLDTVMATIGDLIKGPSLVDDALSHLTSV